MSTLLLGLGLVFVIEGLVLALAPSRLDDILRLLAALPVDQRRLLGLLGVAVGTGLVLLVT
ncbi:MAG: DUF2065 domain-containing protein [Rhodobacteraceae bacterium]|jgi:uncharacterized protein|nr:DUF2065 domain-containing protein [Paracoccaceae bacterium]